MNHNNNKHPYINKVKGYLSFDIVGSGINAHYTNQALHNRRYAFFVSICRTTTPLFFLFLSFCRTIPSWNIVCVILTESHRHTAW